MSLSQDSDSSVDNRDNAESSVVNRDNASPSVNVKGYCYCGRGEDYDSMTGCDNKDCPIEWPWFHYSCLKITPKDVPKDKYFYPQCHV